MMKFKFSIIISLSIFLCMHACTARHLSFVHSKGLRELHSSAEMVKGSFEYSPEMNSMGLERSYEKAKISSHMELTREMKLEKKGEKLGANVITKSLHVSPTNYSNINRPDENPEFYSDYSIPRTRTPSHN